MLRWDCVSQLSAHWGLCDVITIVLVKAAESFSLDQTLAARAYIHRLVQVMAVSCWLSSGRAEQALTHKLQARAWHDSQLLKLHRLQAGLQQY